MKIRSIALTLLILLLVPRVSAIAQQGTVIVRDGTTNTQASVKAAGTPGTNALIIQGNASGIPVPISIVGSASGDDVNIARVGGNAVIGSAGLPVSISACSGTTCYTSPVNAGATVISSGSTSTLFAATTAIVGGHCNNVTNAAVTLTATDGNNVAFIGTTTNGTSFSIPAVSSFSFPPGLIGEIMTSGVRMSASAANAITCWVRGLQ